ncbi:LPXTG cell wall anchor domain-containing protein, partial [Streptomyces chartreusis]
PADDDKPTMSSTVAPKSDGTPSAAAGDDQAQGGSDDDENAGGAAAQTQPPAEDTEDSLGTKPQAVGGNLAETGATTLWPAAGGAVLLIGGLLVLIRARRSAR